VTGPVKRATKVAGRLREAMVAALRELSDPRTQGVLVTRVEVTDDLQSAKIYVRRELGVTEETEQRAMLKGLGTASNRLRREIARSLDLRYAPTLRFFYDEAPDVMSRMEEVLQEIKAKGTPSSGS
jgi:ribosome-binding factor A